MELVENVEIFKGLLTHTLNPHKIGITSLKINRKLYTKYWEIVGKVFISESWWQVRISINTN